jgi:spore maturation protein A
MLNIIWLALVVGSIIISFFNGTTDAVVLSVTQSAKDAVMLAIGLIGLLAFWLGLMKIAETAGMIKILSRAISPLLKFLYPEVPKHHPALDAITLNMSANMLGLGSAATPFGLKAMQELETLNPNPGTATDAMCMFLAVNTSSIQLIPATVMGILAAAHDPNPSSIILPVLCATFCSVTCAVLCAKFFAYFGKRKSS